MTELKRPALPALKKHGKVKIPTKRKLNFATVNEQKKNWFVLIPLILLIFVAAGVFSKFLVLDRLQQVDDARSENKRLRDQLTAAEDEIDAAGELNTLYAHYTYSGFTEQELTQVDRVAVMELLERVVLPRTPLDAWTLSGNRLTLNIKGSTLQDINETVQQLLAEDIVLFCTLNTASTTGDNTVTGAERSEELVTASIVIDLTSEVPEEEAEEA